MKKKTRLYLLTEEELERFDQMLTALGQAYWALARSRSIIVPQIEIKKEITKQEQDFYQLHFDFNEQIDSHENL
jgi:hypothetical protein